MRFDCLITQNDSVPLPNHQAKYFQVWLLICRQVIYIKGKKAPCIWVSFWKSFGAKISLASSHYAPVLNLFYTNGKIIFA